MCLLHARPSYGIGFHTFPHIYLIACATIRNSKSLAGVFTSPTSSRKSSKVSRSAYCGLVLDRSSVVRRGREEERDEFLSNAGRFLALLDVA
jgi:hypothetical protein